MSRPDHALILPISDLDLARDEGTKLRLAGIITAVSPYSALVVLTDLHPTCDYTPASVLVDLSLCIEQPAGRAGWRVGSQTVPPELKTPLMVIGHLVRRDRPVDLSFIDVPAPASSDRSEPQIRPAIVAFQEQHRREELLPNRYFVLEAILAKPLNPTFDLRLWNNTARLRSQHEWQHAKGKHKTRS